MKYGSDVIVGWCPGALRPFESGDGLIVRVRLHLSRMSLVQLETLVSAAERFGDGNLYLSNRANVQLRSVTADKHPALLNVLASASLLDSDARVEAIRNIQVSPPWNSAPTPGSRQDWLRGLRMRWRGMRRFTGFRASSAWPSRPETKSTPLL